MLPTMSSKHRGAVWWSPGPMQLDEHIQALLNLSDRPDLNDVAWWSPVRNIKKLNSSPVRALNAYRGSRCTAPLILNVGPRWVWVVSFTFLPLCPQGKGKWYPLYKRLVGVQALEKREMSCLCWETNAGSSETQLSSSLLDVVRGEPTGNTKSQSFYS
jgi:hypothetical protein